MLRCLYNSRPMHSTHILAAVAATTTVVALFLVDWTPGFMRQIIVGGVVV